VNIMALVPSFYGSTGDAVNERQLIISLAKKVRRCYLITFIGFKQIFTRRREELKKSYLPRNLIVIPFPFPQINVLIVRLVMIIVSYIVSILSLIIGASKKIDLIYVRDSFLSVGFLAFNSLAKKTIVKINALVEDEIPKECITKSLIGKLSSFFDRLVLARAKRVAVPSRSFYDELVRRRHLKHRENPLELPPGVDINLIKKIKNHTKPSLQDNIIIGFLGTFQWWQGIDVLIRSIAILKKNIPNIKLCLVGDGPLRSTIERLCKKLDVVYEITGFIPHEEALKHLAIMDALVLPRKRISTTELIIPIKVIEAWAMGIPVIVTKTRAFLDNQIKNCKHVIYCEPKPESVANAIFTLLTNNELRAELKMSGPKLAKRFDYNYIAENLLKSLTSL